MREDQADRDDGAAEGCGCGSVARRELLKLASLAAAGAAAAGLPAVAGPFEAADFEKLVPADKKLKPEWLESLRRRGTRAVYRGAELEKIGMPIGGIGTGQLYLGGDGRLWHWDVFNKVVGTGAGHYVKPLLPASPLEQGFAIATKAGGKSQVRPLDRSGWSDVSFMGEYPIGYVTYRDPQSPLTVSLTAFSPFIPLAADDSALPATIMQFTVANGGHEPVEAELTGRLENAVCLYTAKGGEGRRYNRIIRRPDFTLLECRAEPLAAAATAEFAQRHDFGTMGLALLGAKAEDRATAALPAGDGPGRAPAKSAAAVDAPASKPFGEKLVGGLTRKLSLAPGQTETVTFVVVWHFPNITLAGLKDVGGRRYGKRFDGAAAVAEHVSRHFQRLADETRLWHDTWYDSTLPYWLLDRTLLNASILATSTCYWFANERFYGWEGVGCCPGTCTHVWHYAHAPARLFSVLERSLREMVDYGIGFDADTGRIRFRAEHNNHWAVDGQAGSILRTYREHQMSADAAFLRRLWPKVRKSLEFLIEKDGNADGILEGPQHNTLDADWFGRVAWLSGLYLAALRAGEEMAREMDDAPFAQRCRDIFAKGRATVDGQLFNGEYFVQLADPAHRQSVGSYDGCEIDQVFGQSWAWQVGLGRILDAAKTRTALKSLWKYNFTPDVGPYREAHKPGRWYALAGEGGLLMCTWPKGEAARVQQKFDYYFNECMTGFEYQVAGHMLAEGLITEGLAIARMIHDRYHPARRNPWNEVECGDHYARAMASYGVYLTACGYAYHGPKGRLAFAPRLAADDFRAAFTTAEGWGTFAQKLANGRLDASLALKWGRLRLRTLALALAEGAVPTQATVAAPGKQLTVRLTLANGQAEIEFSEDLLLRAGETLTVTLA